MNYLLLYLTPFALHYTILSYRLPLSTTILDSQKPQNSITRWRPPSPTAA